MMARLTLRPGHFASLLALLCLSMVLGACSETQSPLAPHADEASARPAPSRDPLEILFIGNSHFNFNDLPALFGSLAADRGQDVEIEARVPLGWSLEDHFNSQVTRDMITSRDWDVVVLQGSGPAVGYPTLVPFNPTSNLILFEQVIHGHCSTTEIMFSMPWAHEDGMLWYPLPHDYFVMYQRIYDNTLAYPEIVDLVIAPVGSAWHAIMLEEPPLHYLFADDWYHPSQRGSYLTACAIYASVFRETAVGAGFLGGLPENEARHFQIVASGTVLNDLELWHLASPVTSVD